MFITVNFAYQFIFIVIDYNIIIISLYVQQLCDVFNNSTYEIIYSYALKQW